jgi:hypothetical protein
MQPFLIKCSLFFKVFDISIFDTTHTGHLTTYQILGYESFAHSFFTIYPVYTEGGALYEKRQKSRIQ